MVFHLTIHRWIYQSHTFQQSGSLCRGRKRILLYAGCGKTTTTNTFYIYSTNPFPLFANHYLIWRIIWWHRTYCCHSCLRTLLANPIWLQQCFHRNTPVPFAIISFGGEFHPVATYTLPRFYRSTIGWRIYAGYRGAFYLYRRNLHSLLARPTALSVLPHMVGKMHIYSRVYLSISASRA